MGLNLNIFSMGVPHRCIKLAYPFKSEALWTIYNQSLQQGTVPGILKISKKNSYWQGGDATDPANYRPIATLSVLSQVFEKLMFKQLSNYIEKHNILFRYQFGFRKGHSKSQAITELTDTLRKAIDSNLYTCGVFLDFSKAFDAVNHEILLSITY